MPRLAWFVLVLAAAPLAAQERTGWWFNAGLGYGTYGCDGCGDRTDGWSGGLAVGGALSPTVLLGIGTTGFYHDFGGARLTAGTLDARLRAYFSRTGPFFFTAGVGLGNAHVATDCCGGAGETGLGVMLGLGADVPLGDHLALTPFWNGFAIHSGNADINVGQLGISLTVLRRKPREAPAAGPPAPPLLQRGYAPASPTAPAIPAPPAASPSPAAPPHGAPDAGRTALPPGTTYVGDSRLRIYYPIGCAAQHRIPPEFQVFFQTSSGAEGDGFKPSGDC